MKGSVKGQTLHLFNTSGLNQIGQSKYNAKNGARMALAAEGRSGTSSNIATKTGIHGKGTRDNYLGKWQELAKYANEEFGIRDLEKITTDHTRAFLAEKIENGVSYSHWSGYAAAVGKLEKALHDYSAKFDRGNSYDLRAAVSELRPEAKTELPRFEGTRNYADPNTLIAETKAQYQLSARIQHESGLRIAGATNIKLEQLRGLSQDQHTGKEVGVLAYVGKGGLHGLVQISPATYNNLKDHIEQNGSFAVSKDGYRSALMSAAEKSGQSYNGSHGLRWNFAQERFAELQSHGASYEAALGIVSHELGHNRIEITYHYLGIT
ncbi:MAG: hypothetical protein FIA89_15340 [Geobacter sp.]|nr:hypothetical protein [Geobacter sp.]